MKKKVIEKMRAKNRLDYLERTIPNLEHDLAHNKTEVKVVRNILRLL